MSNKKRRSAKWLSPERGDDKAESVAKQSGGGWSREGLRRGVLLPSLLGGLCLWLAFPPVGWSVLAWLAPIGWLLIIERPRPVGGRGYVALWISGCLFWLLILQGIRLAYWPLYFGWIALSLYLAVYVPWFVAVARLLRWRWRWPLMLAAPVTWVGLEVLRSYLITGFAANTLAHSQVGFPLVLQIADQLGVYGISLIMMAVSSTVVLGLFSRTQPAFETPEKQTPKKQTQAHEPEQPKRGWELSSDATDKRRRELLGSVVVTAVLVLAMLVYGGWRLAQSDRLAERSDALLRVLLIQENTPTIFESNPERNQLAWTRYLNATREAVVEHGDVDLVAWPESTFTANEPLMEADLEHGLPAELSSEGIDESYFEATLERFDRMFAFKLERVLDATGTSSEQPTDGPHLVLGCDVWHYHAAGIDRYNAALLVGPKGQVKDRYYKVHPVMFGEYIPLEGMLGWLGDAFGMSGIEAGTEPKSFGVGEARISPSICFESTLPWLVSGQVRQLVAEDRAPDVLLNITNDSWFRGSSVLDHHLACSILSAVENRRPMLVAGNTGLSAEIDGAGRVQQRAPRQKKHTILATPIRDGRGGLVQRYGYPLGWLCLAIAVLASCSPLPNLLAKAYRGGGRGA